MKYTIPAIIVLLIISCNTEEKKHPDTIITANGREKLMRDSIALFPDSLILRENLIQYYRDRGSYDTAITETAIAIKRDSNNARLWDIRGSLEFENEDTLGAIQSYEKAVGLLPDPQYMIKLGTLYAQTKNRKALSLADALASRINAGADVEVLFLRGLYYTYSGEKQKAIGFFDQCLAADYTNMDAYREKAVALYDLGKYEDALKVLDKAVTLQNSFDEGYYWSGRCLEKLNRVNDAIESYQTALLYDTSYVEAKTALARLAGK